MVELSVINIKKWLFMYEWKEGIFLEHMWRFENHQVVLIYSKRANILNFVHILFIDDTGSCHWNNIITQREGNGH